MPCGSCSLLAKWLFYSTEIRRDLSVCFVYSLSLCKGQEPSKQVVPYGVRLLNTSQMEVGKFWLIWALVSYHANCSEIIKALIVLFALLLWLRNTCLHPMCSLAASNVPFACSLELMKNSGTGRRILYIVKLKLNNCESEHCSQRTALLSTTKSNSNRLLQGCGTSVFQEGCRILGQI